MSDIRNFIQENKLSFKGGSQGNSTIVTLIGYSQYLGLSEDDLVEELKEEINDDSFIKDEINRLWDYCENNNYKKFWKTDQAKQQYTFI